MKSIPAVVVAGLRSGVGKTTVTLGLIRALADRGWNVAAFKIGPDFLDPSHYKNAGAASARNLDPILQGRHGMRTVFEQSKRCDAMIIEGVMGLFDGPIPGKLTASTAEIARILQVPVLLVCDARSCAQSIAAEIVGARTLFGGGTIVGVVLNFVGSQRHADLLIQSVQRLAKTDVIGWIGRDGLTPLPARHLGLVPAAEIDPRNAPYAEYGKHIAAALPLDRLVRGLTRRSKIKKSPARGVVPKSADAPAWRLTVAIAKDESFSFYYPESIEFFQRHAQKVAFFSPLNDRTAPAADLYYFGGGFPEVFAGKLSANSEFRSSLRSRLDERGKVYAECGGLMYLSRSIVTTDGADHPMAGLIPGRCLMHKRRQALGYWKARVVKPSRLLKKNMLLVGHEYHWSSFEPEKGLRAVYDAEKIGADDSHPGGWMTDRVFASYLHLSPLGNPLFFRGLLDWAADCGKNRGMVRMNS